LFDIQVLLDTFYRVHVLLIRRVQSDKPQHVLGKGDGVGQSETGGTSVDAANTENDKGTREKSYQSTHNVHSEREPSVRSPNVDEGPVLSINLVQVFANKASLIAVSSNGCHTSQCLAKLLIQRAAMNRFEAFEVSGRVDVEATNEEIQYGNYRRRD
jgi:hypothetical protein